MDATLYPTEDDLLRVLLPLVPAATLEAMLAELGLGSVPVSLLLGSAPISIVQAVPGLQTRFFGPVQLTLDQAATTLHIPPATLIRLLQTQAVPVSAATTTALSGQVISAAALLRHR